MLALPNFDTGCVSLSFAVNLNYSQVLCLNQILITEKKYKPLNKIQGFCFLGSLIVRTDRCPVPLRWTLNPEERWES